jgi:hypothetical protein
MDHAWTARHARRLHLLVLAHDLVALDELVKVVYVGGVTPRLQPRLLPDDGREAAEPALTRELCVDVVPRLFGEEVFVVRDVGMVRDVVVDGRELDDLAEEGNVPHGAQVLVPDDGLADCFGLVAGRAEIGEEIEGDDTPVELEGHVRRRDVLVRRADVVQKAAEGVGGVGERRRVLRELLVDNGNALNITVSSALGAAAWAVRWG